MSHDHLQVAVRYHSAVNGGGGLGGERRGGGRGRRGALVDNAERVTA